uniref:Ig-like domain-containing protein n=1 Tax=Equus caballus TaxID=9796 RepID=A0A9L0SZA0_HORSE
MLCHAGLSGVTLLFLTEPWAIPWHTGQIAGNNQPAQCQKMDYTGPLPLSDGCQYGLTCVDTSTGLLQAYPSRRTTQKTTKRGLEHLSSVYGVPMDINSDQDSPHRIKHKNNQTAVLGENVTIFCNLTTPADVVQITWQKIQDSLPQNIGTYSSRYGEKILPPYINRLHCKAIEPNSSFITIREVTFEDEACYKCLFNVFPHGSHGGQTCLNIITVGKPAPQISLSPSQVLINPPEEYLAQNPNGTATISKTYNISLETVRSLRLHHLIVHMDHPLRKEEKIVPLSVK